MVTNEAIAMVSGTSRPLCRVYLNGSNVDWLEAYGVTSGRGPMGVMSRTGVVSNLQGRGCPHAAVCEPAGTDPIFRFNSLTFVAVDDGTNQSQ